MDVIKKTILNDNNAATEAERTQYQNGSAALFWTKPWYAMGHLIEGRTSGKRYLNENAVRARAGLLMLTAVAVVIVLLQIENPRFLIYTVAPVAGWDMLSGAIFGLTPFAPYGIAGTLLAWGKAPEWKPAGPKRFAWTLGFFMVCICVVMGALRLRIGVMVVACTCIVLTWMEAVLGFCLGCWMWNEVVAPFLGREVCVECTIAPPQSTIVKVNPEIKDKDDVTKVVSRHPVVVYSKNKCPYCKKLKALFARLKIEYHSVNLDEQGWDSRAAIVAQLITLTGRRTVPNVFISGHSIGGSDDVHHLHDEGRLLVKIADAHSKAASAQTGADDEHKNQSTVELKAQTTGPDAV